MADSLVADLTCRTCGAGPFKNKAGRAAHERSHPREQEVPVIAEKPQDGPAILEDWRQVQRLASGLRSVTMCDPRCRICESAPNAAADWYKTCPHDPYVTMTPERQPSTYRDIFDENGNPTGLKEEVPGKLIAFRPRPNTREISLSLMANAGLGVKHSRAKGFILPSQVRSPHFPNGIADPCQFSDCKYQKGLKVYHSADGQIIGVFCRREEAAICRLRESGAVMEAGEWSLAAQENRRNQLASADVSA